MNWCLARISDFSAEEYAAVYETMSDSRKAHMSTFRHLGAKQQSLAGELLLRKLLRETGIVTPIERLPSGQPVLQNEQAFVSIAHCDDHVVCAIHDRPIGIDIEKVTSVKPGLAERVCTPEELAYIQGNASRFFEIWTAKEAYFKMKGTGITNFQAVNTLTLPRKLIRQGEYLIQIVCEQKR